MVYLIISCLSLIAVIFIAIYRKQFWKGFLEAVDITSIKTIEELTDEEINDMEEGQLIYVESEATYYKKIKGQLIQL